MRALALLVLALLPFAGCSPDDRVTFEPAAAPDHVTEPNRALAAQRRLMMQDRLIRDTHR